MHQSRKILPFVFSMYLIFHFCVCVHKDSKSKSTEIKSRYFNNTKRVKQIPKVPFHVPEYQAVLGGQAFLPCNYSLPDDPDLVTLMLWYRDHETVPIYTIDFRKGTNDNPKQFPIPEYSDRAYIDVSITLPTLRLDSITLKDKGIYRCNIEFRRLRTVTRVVKLDIIIPPSTVKIRDATGSALKGVIGPYDEGAYLSLQCESEGGDPSPSVTWWREKSLLDDTFYRASQSYVKNELVILELKRSDLLVEITCQTSNTNLTAPLTETIRIDLNLKPLYSRITTTERALKLGEEIRLYCETSGSRPPAKISWWLDNKRIQTGRDSIPNSRNVTYSTLSIKPRTEDNGKNINCRAENTILLHDVVEDSWDVNVLFAPEVSLQLGANFKYSTIKEGNDVYMECNIRANPPVLELAWRFEDMPFYSNASLGVIISNQSLVLQKVKRENRGKYRCIAANTEGRGESMNLFLEVRYAPACRRVGKDIYGVARGETVNLNCEVDSDPAELTFRWSLNNSLDNVELHNFVSNGVVSVLTYTPKTVVDYGALQCWARNSVDEQREPCVIRVIHAGPPDPVRNCIVVNQSHDWILIECESGYSNGLEQVFHLDVYNSAVDHLQANMTSLHNPRFSVHDLPSGTPFVFVVYASNEKGKSNSLAIIGHTTPSPLAQAEAEYFVKFSPLVAIFLAVSGTALLICVIGAAFIQVKKKEPRKCVSIEEVDKNKFVEIVKKTAEDIVESTIACPDVVPPNNSIYFSPGGESIIEIPKDIDVQNYKNCVVALKKSWSFKTGLQEKTEVEVKLPDLNMVTGKHPESPNSMSPLLGDVIIEDCFNSTKKTVLKVESHQNTDLGLKYKTGKSYQTDSV